MASMLRALSLLASTAASRCFAQNPILPTLYHAVFGHNEQIAESFQLSGPNVFHVSFAPFPHVSAEAAVAD
jgi:hypothetical protein